VLKAFAKVRVDARLLRVLRAINVNDDFDAITARGARYGLPGWPVEETTSGGKTKTTCLERYQLRSKARCPHLRGDGPRSGSPTRVQPARRR
jgi:hypothetical protein